MSRHRHRAPMTTVSRPAHGVRARHRRGRGAHTRAGSVGRQRAAYRGRMLVVVAAVVAGVAVPTVGAAAVSRCGWQTTAHDLVQTLDGRTDDRSTMLRNMLTQTGIGPQQPTGCISSVQPDLASLGERTPTSASVDPSAPPQQTDSAAPTTAPAATTAAASVRQAPAVRPTATPRAAPTTGAAADGPTAAAAFGWGTPNREDDFSGALAGWDLYDGPGHAGNGRRSPAATTVAGGLLTINGDANGTTEGMEWGTGQKYGRWEGRVRAPASDPSYNALLLLWPDAENYPVGGEIDFMEMTDHTRQSTNLFLHYGKDDSQVQGEVRVDATQWHNWAVEWTPEGVTTYVDGKPWWHTDDTSILPPGPMHLCIQLNWFPDEAEGAVRPSTMQVDWVRQYSV